MDTNFSHAISCLVIDDEEAAHLALIRLIDSVPWLSLKGRCYSSVQAADMIATLRPELIFLDIEMPGLSGMELIGMLTEPRPQIILTTAFRDYAFEGFENEVNAFLLKPIKATRFYRTVIKIREDLRARHLHSLPGEQGRQQLAECKTARGGRDEKMHDLTCSVQDDSIWIYSGKKFHHLRLNEVYAIEGLKDYVKVHCSEGTILVKGSIGSIERKLPSSHFIRIHRSYIINRSAIRLIEGNMVRMPDGSKYTIPSYKSRENIINRLLDRQRRI
ncbi:DNA-binding response regulator [Dyadobacter endophyticus]|uniref:DNA-binding response regulator n=1 Tax=Dyadobacter endophyticus TaxID=1749036 RepID=A0ABQ1YCV4_9BACT|nr:LytTR family transcriptional regulator DNA-binding domain-containing protein [Dyadobacter endophyticus]GGH20538.1 DNA-binding response regulator [Dyadobacter endophyticus]